MSSRAAATTSSILSPRQEEELRLAIVDYLSTAGLNNTCETLQKEASITGFVADGKQKYSGLLEKKWMSVIRLQKKIMDLETQVAQLRTELESAPPRKRQGSGGVGGMSGGQVSIPRIPEKHRLSGHRGTVTKVAFHPTYTVVATASEDCTVKIWDFETGAFERTVKGHTRTVQDVAFHPTGTTMATCSADLSVKLWDVENNYACIRTLHGHDHSVSAVSFSPMGDHILTASRDQTLRLWELSTGYATRTIHGHDEWVRDVAWSDDGNYAASASNDQTIIVWETNSWIEIARLRGHSHVVEAVAFAPASVAPIITKALSSSPTSASGGSRPTLSSTGNAVYVVSGSRDKSLRLWDAISGQCLIVMNGHENWIRDVVFYPSSPHIISVSDDKTLCVWDISTGKSIKSFEAHSHFVTSVAVHHSQAVLATGSVDHGAKLWYCSS